MARVFLEISYNLLAVKDQPYCRRIALTGPLTSETLLLNKRAKQSTSVLLAEGTVTLAIAR